MFIFILLKIKCIWIRTVEKSQGNISSTELGRRYNSLTWYQQYRVIFVVVARPRCLF